MILSSSLPGCTIECVIRNDVRLVVFAQARRVHGRCSTCGTTSSAVHSRYERCPADLPSVGQPMTLRLRIRRFYCHYRACRRRTFAESLPQLMPPRACRTRRLAQAQTRIGLTAEGEPVDYKRGQLQHGAKPYLTEDHFPGGRPREGAASGRKKRLRGTAQFEAYIVAIIARYNYCKPKDYYLD